MTKNNHNSGFLFSRIFKRKQSGNYIFNSKEKYRTLIENLNEIVYIIDKDGNVVYLSPSIKTISDYSISELNQMSFLNFVHPDDKTALMASLNEALAGQQISTEFRILAKKGGINWMSTSTRPIYRNGRFAGIQGVLNDITERKKLESSLAASEERFRKLFYEIPSVAVQGYYPDGTVFYWNHASEILYGYTEAEAVGKKLTDLIIPDDMKSEVEANFREMVELGKTRSAESLRLRSKHGDDIPVYSSHALLKYSDERMELFCVDIDLRNLEKMEEQIAHMNDHDDLTGLYNRKYMEAAVKRLDQKYNLPFTIMSLDVNGLKLANDAFGHEAGDRLLKTVAEIISGSCRSNDLVGRTGGDEFEVLLPNIDEKTARQIEERIVLSAEKASIDSVVISLAIGFAVKTSVEQEIMEIKKLAENEMYKNKQKTGKIMHSRTIETVLRNINSKYDREQIHTERVSQYCMSIARALGFDEEEILRIGTAGSLHDIGKIIVSPELLNKPMRLSEDEFSTIKQHTETGYQILRSVDEFASLAYAVRCHHERWDGMGYPIGLKGEEIPLIGRIIAVADAYEAMTAKRTYQPSKTNEEAIAELVKCAGTQFDPAIVRVFVQKVLNQ